MVVYNITQTEQKVVTKDTKNIYPADFARYYLHFTIYRSVDRFLSTVSYLQCFNCYISIYNNLITIYNIITYALFKAPP